MTPEQAKALRYHCRLAAETMQRRFARALPRYGVSVVLSVNSGYE